MRHSVQNAFALLREHPLRGFLSLLAMLAGAFLLGSAWGVADGIVRLADRADAGQGTVIALANGSLEADGNFAQAKGASFDASVADLVQVALPAATRASPVVSVPFTRYQTDKGRFQVRNALGVGPGYLDTMGLEIVAGQALDAADVQGRRAVVLLSSDAAAIIFGGEDPVGKSLESLMFGRFQAASATGRATASGEAATSPVPRDIPRQVFTVKGVYKSPSEADRQRYGIPDALLPYTAAMPGGVEIPDGFYWSTVVFAVKGLGLESAKVAVNSAIAAAKGDAWKAAMWQGDPSRPSLKTLDASRQLDALVAMINALGVVLIFVSGVGMHGMMTVEVAGRSKHYGIRRALGASAARVLGSIVAQAASLAALGALPGVILAALLGKGLIAGFTPWYELVGLDPGLASGLGFNPLPYLLSLLAVVAAAAFFGLLPGLRVLRTSPVGLLREEGV